jgi:hypothetical protein
MSSKAESKFKALLWAAALAASGMLAGCSGSSSSPLAPTEAPERASVGARTDGARIPLSLAAGPVRPARSSRQRAWISPDVKETKETLFVSDFGLGTVSMYSLPKLKPEGVPLTDLNGPNGECSDSSGDVWVTNTGADQMIELSKTGSVINTINNIYGEPLGCAVNPVNGDLAVTVDSASYTAINNVTIYPGNGSAAYQMQCAGMNWYYFAGFDNSGDIMVDGLDDSEAYMACYGNEVAIAPLSLGATIYFPGPVLGYVRSGVSELAQRLRLSDRGGRPFRGLPWRNEFPQRSGRTGVRSR